MHLMNERVVYVGSSGAAVLGFAASFPGLDGDFMPVSDEYGLFRIKQSKPVREKHSMMADPCFMSFPYPDTNPEVVLTVLPGWDHGIS